MYVQYCNNKNDSGRTQVEQTVSRWHMFCPVEVATKISCDNYPVDASYFDDVCSFISGVAGKHKKRLEAQATWRW